MIKTGVIAAAGRGSRLLPFSGFVPKELLPLGSVPVIQYVTEELFEAGVERVIVITDPSKEALIRFFDAGSHESFVSSIKDNALKERQKKFAERLSSVEVIIDYQSGKYGNATPLLTAEKYIHNEPFFYTWADDFIHATPTRFRQLADSYEAHKKTVLSGIRAVRPEDYDNYAYIEAVPVDSGIYKLSKIHEKPGAANAPSDIGVLSGHLFSNEVLEYLHEAYDEHKDGEFLFNDILHLMISKGVDVMVREIENAEYVDTGNVRSYANNFVKFVD